MNEENDKQGFWKTVPGIITTITGIIVALTGLITAINESGIIDFINKQLQKDKIELPERPEKLIGNYTVNGKNPNGTLYYGKAIIEYENSLYQIKWEIADKQTYYGSGKLEDNLLKINWEGGIVTYVIRDNKLVGTWADGRGTETLTPIKYNF